MEPVQLLPGTVRRPRGTMENPGISQSTMTVDGGSANFLWCIEGGVRQLGRSMAFAGLKQPQSSRSQSATERRDHHM